MKTKDEVLCFVKCNNKILLINRNKYPFMGMWNAIGGHVEVGESTIDAALRETKEESGIVVTNATLISKFTWNYDDSIGYAYLVELDDSFDLSSYPKKINEGIVDFKDIDWIIDEKNYGIVPDLRIFLNDIKKGLKNDYHLVYNNDKLVEVIKK